MILAIRCEACDETLDLVRVHEMPEDGWGKAVVCFEEQRTLREALKAHNSQRCAHLLRLRQENLLRRLQHP